MEQQKYTAIQMQVKAEKLENQAFATKAIHKENRGDQRFQVSMPVILNHCHRKEVY